MTFSIYDIFRNRYESISYLLSHIVFINAEHILDQNIVIDVAIVHVLL